MPIARCAGLVPVLLAAMTGTVAAQARTPPRDTLRANFPPRFWLAPDPRHAPLPGDTLEAMPGPTRPDGALLVDPHEIEIPERIAGLRIA